LFLLLFLTNGLYLAEILTISLDCSDFSAFVDFYSDQAVPVAKTRSQNASLPELGCGTSWQILSRISGNSYFKASCRPNVGQLLAFIGPAIQHYSWEFLGAGEGIELASPALGVQTGVSRRVPRQMAKIK
jgi:hypothetical protein